MVLAPRRAPALAVIALSASPSARAPPGALNMWYDADIDA
jgi:heme O synthase-like polyprenyltransferase